MFAGSPPTKFSEMGLSLPRIEPPQSHTSARNGERDDSRTYADSSASIERFEVEHQSRVAIILRAA